MDDQPADPVMPEEFHDDADARTDTPSTVEAAETIDVFSLGEIDERFSDPAMDPLMPIDDDGSGSGAGAAGTSAPPRPADGDVGETAGDPVRDEEWYIRQRESGLCGPTTVAQIVAEYRGVSFDSMTEGQAFADGVVETAQRNGWITFDPSGQSTFGRWSGMTGANIENLLEAYDIESTMRTEATVDDLESLLEQDYSLVAFVDGHELWEGRDDDAFDQGRGSNHVLVVTGIDEDNGWAYLNDPGIAHGQGWRVPLETFRDAWSDSGNRMLVTDTPPTTQPDPVVAQPAPVEDVPQPDPVVAQPAPVEDVPQPDPVVAQPAPVEEDPQSDPATERAPEEPHGPDVTISDRVDLVPADARGVVIIEVTIPARSLTIADPHVDLSLDEPVTQPAHVEVAGPERAVDLPVDEPMGTPIDDGERPGDGDERGPVDVVWDATMTVTDSVGYTLARLFEFLASPFSGG